MIRLAWEKGTKLALGTTAGIGAGAVEAKNVRLGGKSRLGTLEDEGPLSFVDSTDRCNTLGELVCWCL